MNKISSVLSYLNFYLGASTKHDIHSPFVFELLTGLIESKEEPPAFAEIEQLRKQLLCSEEEIDVRDLGAGSRVMQGRKRKIRDIARTTSVKPKYGQLLFRLNKRFGSGDVLEMGTSLGISSLYLQKGNPQSRLCTLEGCPQVAERAQQNFKLLGEEGIQVITGDFSLSLPAYLSRINQVDLVFFDGNHQQEPTLAYFNACLEKAHSGTVFVFDDIHWSPGMLAAWEEIKNNRRVRVSLDLFFMGLVFFREEQEKQHFRLRF